MACRTVHPILPCVHAPCFLKHAAPSAMAPPTASATADRAPPHCPHRTPISANRWAKPGGSVSSPALPTGRSGGASDEAR